MKALFDAVAEKYDSEFTQSQIGKAQRKIVWDYLERILSEKKELKILELNCGTGEDAIWFAKKGHLVTATDQSEKMLEVTKRKVLQFNLAEKIKTEKIDLTQIEELNLIEKYDLIFSNFGGINCISFENLSKLTSAFGRLLTPTGRLIMVIMPTFCLWEIIYFLLKLNMNNAFRRSSTRGTKFNINGAEITIEYYTPTLVKKIFSRNFELVGLKPVGFFIPPSYLENFFSSKRRMFDFITKLESIVTDWTLLSNYSDHYLIDLKLNINGYEVFHETK